MAELNEGGASIDALVYVNTPQNDKKQIEQIVTEYEGHPAKGLAHGIQKDAIQNGVGARIGGNEPNSYKDWRFTFELLKIKGAYALSFRDEGTTGLTGEILDDEEIEKWSAEEKLTAEENLSRFLTRFDSGGNIGPGTFGRGKLIFQGGSNSSAVLCDSLRYDDKKYIAFARKIIGNQLKQLKKPLVGKDAEEFIKDATGEELEPLSTPGTRIVILDLKEEIIDAIKNSFNGSGHLDYYDTFAGMIEETWWEIINKFDAKIFVKWNDETKQVKLTEPLRSIARADDKENGWRIYSRKLETVVVDEMPYKIKELRFALSPEPLHEDFHEVWIQRRRMKIGSISRNIYVHHKIQRRLCGYLVLDEELEDLIEKGENPTHYTFNYNRKSLPQIREVLRVHLDAFQTELGLKTESEQAIDRRDMVDTLNEINENASELGLLTDFAVGSRSKDVEISVKSFKLPNENSKRVEYNQGIGPIELTVTNNTSKAQFIRLFLTAEQRGGSPLEKGLHQGEIDLEPKEVKTVTIGEFEFERDDFRYGEGVLIAARVNNRKSGIKMAQVSRMVWLGREEPENSKPFKVTAYRPLFPRPKTTRVELTESIRNLMFRITNNTAIDAKLNIRIVVRKCKTDTADYITVKELKIDENVEVGAMSDKEYSIEKVEISKEDFGWIFDTDPDTNERKCEIFISAKAAEHFPEINIIKKKTVGRSKIPFYLGIDPPGHSVFSGGVREVDDPKEHRRSYYEGTSASGYTCVINIGHNSYRFAKDNGTEVKKYYMKEQIIRQAYIIAIKESKFGGVLDDYEGPLSDMDTPPAELFMVMDEIIGKAFKELEA